MLYINTFYLPRQQHAPTPHRMASLYPLINYPDVAGYTIDIGSLLYQLKFILPIVVLFMGIGVIFSYRRRTERKAAQYLLQESEAHLRLSQRDGGIGTWETDLVNNKYTWSENCISLLGLNAYNEPTWDDFLSVVHHEERQRVIDALQSHLDHGTKFEVEYRIVQADKSISWMRSIGQVERNTEGSALRIRGIVQNFTERKLARDKLRMSDLALKAISQGVIITTPDQTIQWANDAFFTITGYSFPEIVGKNCRFLQGPQTDPVTVKAIDLALKNEQEFSGEILNYRKDGSTFWINLMISLVRDEQGRLSHFIGVMRDITENKHNEILIRQNEQHLRDILNVSPIAVRISGNQGNEILFYNATYASLIKNPQVLEVNPVEYYAKKEDYLAILSELEQGHTVLNRQIEFLNPYTGLTFWALSSYMPIQYQNKSAVLGWFYDVTELMEARKILALQLERQRQAEETLRIASAEEHAIFDSATSGIVLIKDNVIQRCNRKLEEIFGYAPGELNGQPTRLWYPDDNAYESGGHPVYQTILEGKFQRLELQFIRKEGSLFWARFSGKALDNNDYGQGLVAIIDDITLEHEAIQSLLKAKIMAEEATRTKSEFMANMSHEIRTPMNGVLGMLDLLRETAMTPKQLDWLETAHRSGENLLEIINDILDFSKLDAGQFELEQIDFNLTNLMEDCCALMASQAHAKGLALNFFTSINTSSNWCGDPMRIRQVLTNLIGNAIKFTDKGEVSLSISHDKPNELRFEVRDTGIGISPEVQLHLFNPFTQADSATSRRFGGTGLGLSISKRFVELMGGRIGVNSNLGQGACFWFTLPLPARNSQEISPLVFPVTPANNKPISYQNKKVLVVEDNKINQKVIIAKLAKFDLNPDVAENGQVALDKLKQTSYDLIFMDCHMPVMDGYTATRELRLLESRLGLSHQPVIALTANALDGEREKCLLAGMDDYLTKPLVTDQLTALLARRLGQ